MSDSLDSLDTNSKEDFCEIVHKNISQKKQKPNIFRINNECLLYITNYLKGIDKAKFRIPVVPGDQLLLETSLINQRRNFWVFEGNARVDDKLAAQAEIKLMLHSV